MLSYISPGERAGLNNRQGSGEDGRLIIAGNRITFFTCTLRLLLSLFPANPIDPAFGCECPVGCFEIDDVDRRVLLPKAELICNRLGEQMVSGQYFIRRQEEFNLEGNLIHDSLICIAPGNRGCAAADKDIRDGFTIFYQQLFYFCIIPDHPPFSQNLTK